MAIIGIGGFGSVHTRIIEQLSASGEIRCVAFAEMNMEKWKKEYETLTALGAIHYEDYKEMLAKHPEIEFVVIATPIALHKPMSIYAMEQGFHVLTEKPPAVTVEDVQEMIDAQKRTGKRCAVQFQNTSGQAFRQAVQLLKEGAIGEVRKVTGIGMWKRTDEYYERTPWAGKLKHQGEYVLDGTLHNPFAHLVYNCMIAAGSGDVMQAVPDVVQAELYRGHRIESEDTACVRATMQGGVQLHIYTTLCHTENAVPSIEVEGSDGRMHWYYNNRLVVTDRSGHEREYRYEPLVTPELMPNMYRNLIEAIRDPEVQLLAPIGGSLHYLMLTNGAFESSGIIRDIPEEYMERKPEGNTIATYIRDCENWIKQAAKEGKLFSEMGWGETAAPFALKNYKRFTWGERLT
jgi:predicted dehydrogenase